MSHDIIRTLDSHFRCLDVQVTCARARSFLPGLLDPAVELRIPTPITVHLDQCPHCAADLHALRELNLDGKQLQRLHWLYGHGPTQDRVLCRRARSKVPAFIHGDPDQIDAEIRTHMALCLRCRAEIYLQRQALLEQVPSADGCDENITVADLFDYAVPSDEAARGAGRPAAGHVVVCRPCLETIQGIHRVIFGVMERAESGVATIYSTIGDAEAVDAPADDAYAEYAVRVQTIHQETQPALASVAAEPRRIPFNPHTRRLLKAAVAAAAVIPLALLFQATHSASGITLAEVVRAFDRANNVHVVLINPIDEQVSYELLFSRKLNIAELAVRGKPAFLYDLGGRRKGNLATDSISPIDDGEHAHVKRMVDSALGFTLSDIPSDARWTCLESGGAYDIYELVWTLEAHAGLFVDVKCEITVDTRKRLPVESRVSTKQSVGTEWECGSQLVFSYPTDSELEMALMRGSATETERSR